MELTLKKASLLAQKCFELAAINDAPNTIQVSVWDSTEDGIKNMVSAAKKKYEDNLRRQLVLTSAGYQIRSLISDANSRHGIDELMNLIAKTKKQLELLGASQKPSRADYFTTSSSRSEAVATIDNSDDVPELMKLVDRFRTSEPKPAPNSFMKISIVGEELEMSRALTIENCTNDIEKMRERLTELNFTVRITIPNELEEVLRTNKVLRD